MLMKRQLFLAGISLILGGMPMLAQDISSVNSVSYEWKSVPIVGGGFVDGIVFLTETSPQLFGVCQVSTGNVVQHKDSIAFTDLDIAWFNPKTREIKFKEYDKIKSIPIYASISVKSSSETLFIIAANINPVVNRAYDDLVLFCDKDGKYYLNDNYPNYWNLEKTKQNADKRSEGWNKFINLLRKEGRIK